MALHQAYEPAVDPRDALASVANPRNRPSHCPDEFIAYRLFRLFHCIVNSIARMLVTNIKAKMAALINM